MSETSDMRLSSYPNPLFRGWYLGRGVQEPQPWYAFARKVLQVVTVPMFKLRVFNRHFEPTSGSAVFICNHQSFVDPILISVALRRPMNYMARDSLFRIPIFGPLIFSYNAFPVKRGTADTGAIKEAMRRLKNGAQVVMFAEGTRTIDGHIQPFLPGVAMLAQRSADWTVPVVIDGAYEAWPRTQKWPSPGHVTVQYGEPIPQSETRKLSAQELVDQLRQTMIQMQGDMRRRLGRPPLDYDDV